MSQLFGPMLLHADAERSDVMTMYLAGIRADISRAGVAISAADSGRLIVAFFCRRRWAMVSLIDGFGFDVLFAGAGVADTVAANQS